MTKRKPLAEPLPEPSEGYRAREGMRVQVLSTDKKRNLGLGTIVIVGQFALAYPDGSEEIISDHYPMMIVLDNGRTTEGCKCWWYPVKAQNQKEKDD